MDLRDKRETYNGFGETLSRAFEFAATPAIFGGLGALVDHWVGTHHVFLIVFVLFAFIGMFVRMWLGYDQQMRRQESQKPWSRS